jgi:hypothetical protein
VTVTTAEEKNTGECREGQIEAQRSRLTGGRASQGRGEAMGGAVVDREGLGWSAHGGPKRQQWSSTVAAVLCLGKDDERE